MRASTTSILAAVAAFAPAVLAGPSFTAPIATTSCVAGQDCMISWKDDGIAPLLADYGDCIIGVYAGSQNQQSLMQAVAPANAASTGSIVFTPDAGMGENSGSYFIKMISVNTADPAQPQYKATAYSAMFTLTGMTGTFSDTVKAQIAGTAASSGAVASGSAPATTAAATTAAATTSASALVTSTVAKASASATHSTTASASSTAAASSANGLTVASMGAFGATVAAIFASFL